MTTANGQLNDGREVYLNGERVADMASEPVFSRTLKVIQRYYELQKENKNHTFFNNGIESSIMFLAPKTTKDLEKKRRIYEEVARESYGMLGRTPDFINTGVAILANYADVLGVDQVNPALDYAQNAKNWAKHVKFDDVFVSHAIQNPQIDRQKTLTELLNAGNEFAGVWIKERREDGVIVRGAKQVNTLAPLADELLIFNLPGLSSEDKNFALAFALPIATPGVKIICRKTTMHLDHSLADYPLSNAFDEMDAFIVFDDVFVPNDALLVCGDVDKSNAFFEKSGLFNHTAHQDEVRGFVKLEFVTGIAVRLAEKLGLSGFQRVEEMLGQLSVNLEMIRSSIIASEVTGKMENGVFTPNMQTLLAVRATLTGYYDEALRVIAEFSAGSAVGVPDFRQFSNVEISTMLKDALTSEQITAEERTLLLNLAWDITSESFGQRQRVYEFLHGGNPMFIRMQHLAKTDLTQANAMIDKVLENARNDQN
ncbi:4-hydroxyphenylacetate 3-hydroxylase N-terminal domain-containing protein [Lactococcus insecticola]|uniref:4-hydroxyphenylacetate 3-hydroxylase N-terminal domain-containing protein n=1 Tax=Pseudolactococcus insecticola TaxID=2709158 RepID=UPI0013C09FFE|nr:4-hydroxyphenylacetate 3-hydroxylase N-terminal domain-containing protein [Lactococcus insecticola]GFH40504.1 4-hydroxyphenylacetate-3-hydroxylase,C-terminus (pseudogene) [Lactococcus insecticola]